MSVMLQTTPRFFAVLGNRDHIKVDGARRPFHEFLDRQPDGWLSSLVYVGATVFPADDRPRMLDCGAWSYKHEPIPVWKRQPLHSELAVQAYAPYLRLGDFAIAPDHMLIDGVDAEERQAYNLLAAETFLRAAPPTCRPMAVVHGRDVPERIVMARQFVDLGYQALAIGGIAARAAQPKVIRDIVQSLRQAVPMVWLHVLGLSSPKYAAWWQAVGIQSFDGSSHFKQAFTAGTFYVHAGAGRLVKHQAGRPGTDVSHLPVCLCAACDQLRGLGIDTRLYGSNEHNMGRAAHNLNQLMAAHEAVWAGAPDVWSLS
ncbi:MAG TPA: hypothetical protein VKE26_26210 [Xanthobacteraceae bacterium]|nr:hypothetical protein [Xanthobacteraceae bacterium]